MKILILFSIMIFLFFLPHIVEATNGWAVYTNTTAANVGRAVMRNWTGDAIEAGVATGTDSGGARSWQKLRCLEQRQECLLIWNDADNDISFEIFNTTALTWSGYVEVEGSANNDDTQNFDVECEDLSGECLIIYDDAGTDNQQIAYRVYNDSGLNAEQILTIGPAAGLADWIRLYPKSNSDEIMLVMADDNLATSAILWNGTSNSFKASAQTITTVAPLLNRKSFDFAWEGSSGEGLLTFGNTTDGVFGFTYINYAWTNIGLLYNNGAQAYTIHMCGSNPLMSGTNHDYIGIMVNDQDSDLTGRVWDGTAIETSPAPPSEDASTEGAIPTENIQCMWETTSKNQAVFIWVDSGALTPEGGTYTIGTGWSFAGWDAGSSTGMTTWQDDVDDLQLVPDPESDVMFVIGQDLVEDIECMRWMGDQWNATSCGLLDSNAPSSLFESDTFDWSRYIPPSECTVAIGLSTALATGIAFGNVDPGQTADAAGNNGAGVTNYYITVSISGCTPNTVNVYTKASGDMISGSYSITLSNEKFRNSTSDNTVPATLHNISLTTNYADNKIGNLLTDGSYIYLKYNLNIPTGQRAASNYQNTIYFWGGRSDQTPP